MLQGIFGFLLGSAMLAGLATGKGEAVFSAALAGAAEGIATAFSLAGGFAFFCGLMEVLRRSGAVTRLARRFAPALAWLLGGEVPGDALDYVALNFSANLLGLGNAATPMGVEAAKRMATGERAGNALCMFLVINASSVQLLPTSVIALRAAAGSASPGAVALPTLAATGISTLVGILSCKIAEKKA